MLSMSIEKCVSGNLNKWDTTPGLSTIYSGPLRILASTVQIVAGSILTIISALFGWIGGVDNWQKDITINAKEIAYGLRNLVRGSIASVPGLGNLLIYLFDKSSCCGKGHLYVLRRGPDGCWIVPEAALPTLIFSGGRTGAQDLEIDTPELYINTARGIVPEGWVIEY